MSLPLRPTQSACLGLSGLRGFGFWVRGKNLKTFQAQGVIRTGQMKESEMSA